MARPEKSLTNIISIVLTDEDLKRANEAAKSRKKTRAAIVREALRAYFESQQLAS